MFADLWTLFLNLPNLFEATLLVWEAIQAGRDFIDLRIKLRGFDEAADKAVHAKDTSELEAIFNPKDPPAPPQP